MKANDMKPEQLAYFKSHFPVDSNKSVAEALGLTLSQVYRFGKELDLSKDAEALSRRRSTSSSLIQSRLMASRYQPRKK